MLQDLFSARQLDLPAQNAKYPHQNPPADAAANAPACRGGAACKKGQQHMGTRQDATFSYGASRMCVDHLSSNRSHVHAFMPALAISVWISSWRARTQASLNCERTRAGATPGMVFILAAPLSTGLASSRAPRVVSISGWSQSSPSSLEDSPPTPASSIFTAAGFRQLQAVSRGGRR